MHINLETSYSADFSVKELPKVRVIKRVTQSNSRFALPQIKQGARVGILLGSHSAMSAELTRAIDTFCAKYDAVVFCDHTSGYYGAYRVFHCISSMQYKGYPDSIFPNLVIHLGEISVYSYVGCENVWRVSEDGELRDTFRRLDYVFEMPEIAFFETYNALANSTKNGVNAVEKGGGELCRLSS